MKKKRDRYTQKFVSILILPVLVTAIILYTQAAQAVVVVPVASLGDRVWEDKNGNGIQDGGELGIPNVTVKLYKCDGSLVSSTITDVNGNYYFTNLQPGTYFVEFVLPNGYKFSPPNQGGDDTKDSDADPLTGKTACTDLIEGENDLSWDAGLYKPASLGDFVWHDTNRDGIQDPGEPGFSGVTVNLYKDGNSLATTTTDSAGKYLFPDLIPGEYSVEFIAPAGYVFSPKDQGTSDLVDSDADTSTGKSELTNLDSGENDLSWDAGLYQPPPAEIGDRVWEDLNANGIQDSGEPGIPGVTVNLYECGNDGICGTADDQWEGTQTTDANGFYLFTNLAPGSYCLEFVKPAGYSFSPKNAGSSDKDSDADLSTGRTVCTRLESAESDRTWDAGLYRLASIGDFVWNDKNNDGIQDADEPGIPGVTVKLYSSGADGVCGTADDVLQETKTTDANGFYLFDHLMPGSYYLEFVLLPGYAFSPANQGSNEEADSNPNITTGRTECTGLVSGENDLSWDAGMYIPCDLQVEKTCYIAPPPPPPFVCSDAKPIDTIKMIWDGTQRIRIKAWKGAVNSTLLADIDNIMPKQEVTVSGYAGSPNDVIWEVFAAGTSNLIGKSTFHLSCSDVDMNGPEDCGKREGNGKTTDSSWINDWILEGMIGSNGLGFDCTAENSTGSSNCSVPAPPPPPNCLGHLISIKFQYLEGGCVISNPQGGKATCKQLKPATTGPVRIVVLAKDGSPIWLDTGPADIMIGDVVTASAPAVGKATLEADTKIRIYDESNVLVQEVVFHTSCSQPLNLGDQFGSLKVVGMQTTEGGTASLGAEVEYTYKITNKGSSSVSGIVVWDDHLGVIPGSPIALGPGETKTLKAKAFVDETTRNTVTASAFNGQCAGYAWADVTVTPLQPPPFACLKPISELSMMWDGDYPIRVRAWKGNAGSTLLADIDNIAKGNVVTVTGYAGAPNDVVWEIFKPGTLTKIGYSMFHISCSDVDMNGPEDCGKYEGNGKDNKPDRINLWKFDGMCGSKGCVECDLQP